MKEPKESAKGRSSSPARNPERVAARKPEPSPARKPAKRKSTNAAAAPAKSPGGRGRKKTKKRGFEEGVRAALITSIAVFASLVLAIILVTSRFQEDAPLVSYTLEEEREALPQDVPPEALALDVPPEDMPGSGPGGAPNDSSTALRQPETTLPAKEVPSTDSPSAPRVVKPSPVRPKLPEAALPPASPSPERPEGRLLKPMPGQTGSLVLVIDDAGNNLKELEGFLSFPGQISLAVLPGLPYSREAARRIRSAGKEVILHQPMEALGGQNPGPAAIYSDMGEAAIRALLRRNVDEVGPVTGMNNHQGSKITTDARIMEVVLSFCEEEGIFFLDSRTTADTVVPRMARAKGMRILERDVFLDNQPDRSYIVRAFQDGVYKATGKGAAVMIGHTWSLELASTLHQLYPELIEDGWSLSTISRLMMDELLVQGPR